MICEEETLNYVEGTLRLKKVVDRLTRCYTDSDVSSSSVRK